MLLLLTRDRPLRTGDGKTSRCVAGEATQAGLRGVASGKRSPQLPDIPTINESGVPGYEAVNWFGLLAPAKTPKRIVARLDDAMAKVVRMSHSRSRIEAPGTDPVGSSPEECASYMRGEFDKYEKVVKLSGAKVD